MFAALRRLVQIFSVYPKVSARSTAPFRLFTSRVIIQVVVLKCNGNSAVESRIERLDSVGGQEQNTLVVLQQSQEDTNHGISFNILLGSPL
jgi:hypothetical protein